MGDVTKRQNEPTSLTARLAVQIAEHISNAALSTGHPLVERKLATLLRVSRSPIRGALLLLEREGIVAQSANGGYSVRRAKQPALENAVCKEENLYRRIAEDRLSGNLAERITENELMRRYAVSRAELSHLLRRAAAEGWIERLPGHGWAFTPILTSIDAYRKSFQFRSLLEPAAILMESFSLQRAAIEQRRLEQKRLIDGDIWSISTAALFDLNSGFHETVMACSNNPFCIDSLQRTNILRRLIEYRHAVDRTRSIKLCHEHLMLAELLLEGDLQAAAFYMRRHLSEVGVEKASMNQASVTGSL